MCEVHKPEKMAKPYPVWRCKLCKKDTALSPLNGRCQFCNYPELEERQVTAKEYCELVGHDGGEVRLPGTSQFERKEWDALVIDFRASLAKFNVPEKEQNELLAIVGSTKNDIVMTKGKD